MNGMPTFRVGEFRKARASDPNQNCVRVARKLGWAVIWDDKPVGVNTVEDALVSGAELLCFTDEQFDSWQHAHRLSISQGQCLSVSTREDGLYVFRATVPQPVDGVELTFDRDEINAFYDGVNNHEFDAVEFAHA